MKNGRGEGDLLTFVSGQERLWEIAEIEKYRMCYSLQDLVCLQHLYGQQS